MFIDTVIIITTTTTTTTIEINMTIFVQNKFVKNQTSLTVKTKINRS